MHENGWRNRGVKASSELAPQIFKWKKPTTMGHKIRNKHISFTNNFYLNLSGYIVKSDDFPRFLTKKGDLSTCK